MFCVILKLCVILAMVSSSFLPSSPIMVEGHSEEGSSKSISGSSTRSDAIVGLQVLVVDDDKVNLKILKSLLTSYKHEVVTVSRPTDALNKLYENEGGFDLVITDIHMPIMNGFDLLQIIKKDFKNIPVIMISSENSNDIRLKTLQRGACHYEPKPICESFIQTIWQYVFCKQSSVNNQRSLDAEGSVQEEASSHQKLIRRESIEISSSAINVKNLSRQQENKRKRKPRVYDDDDDDYEDDVPAPKKTRMVWTPKLHERFMEAIDKIGLEKAVPRKIREVMSVPGVSRTNIASHLQKYRLYLKSSKDPNQSRRSFRNSRYYSHENRTSGYTPSYNSSMSYKSPQGFAQFPEKLQSSQFASYQPAWGSNFRSLNNALNMPSVGQSRFYNQGLSSNGSFVAQPRCGYSPQMFNNSQGNMGQSFLSSAPNYLNRQNVGSQQTFGMGMSLDGNNFSYMEGDPIMHQFFPDAPVEQQKFSNGDFQGQSNLQSFDTIDFMNLAPDSNLTDSNNPSCKSNYVGFQLSNNEGVIGLRQTGMDSVEDSTVVNANVDQLDDIGNGMMSMEGVETSPMPNFDTMNFNQVTPVGSNFTGAFANSDAFQTAPLITTMDQLQLQPNEGGGILENWCDIIRNNSTNDLSYLLSNNGGCQQNQVHGDEGLIMDPQFGIGEFQFDENYSEAM